MRHRGRRPPRRLFAARRSGQALVLVAISAIVVLGMAALSLDLGMLYVARGEAQRAADAAALGGATALVTTPGDRERARRVATSTAALNTVRRRQVTLAAEDVVVTDTSVEVWVRRLAARGEGIPTMFGGIIGTPVVDVTARARARVHGARSATCLKPFIVPDLWHDANRNGRYDAGELYDPQVTGYGTTFRTDRVRDIGRPITLQPGTSGQPLVPSWYFLMRMPGNEGGADIRATIASTTCNRTILSAGEQRTVDQESGLKKGPVRQGVEDLIAQDPGAYWDETTRTIRGSRFGEDAWRASPRVFNIALFDPRQPVEPGTRPITITNFATVFVERTASGDNIVGRFLPVSGLSTGGDCAAAGNCAPFARTVGLSG